MRTQDAKLFTDNLAEIVASRPDVLESVTEYFKNSDQIREAAITDLGKFSNDTYREALEFMRKNADVKGFVLEIVKLIDKLDFITESCLFLIMQALKEGHVKTVIAILEEYFGNSMFINKIAQDNEDNNENNGH